MERKELEKIPGMWSRSGTDSDEEAKELRTRRRQSMEQRQQERSKRRQRCE